MTSTNAVHVLGIGGSLREGSQSERALRIALDGAAEAGVTTELIAGPELVLPFYDTALAERHERAVRLVEAIRRADGIVVVSPGYHGALSGLVKNALDYVEDLRDDARPYLDGRAVGLAAVAFGWQAAVTTLEQLRTITHALRGWATPLGGSINTAETKFDEAGGASDDKTVRTLRLIGSQVAEFARSRAGH
ncbi:NADPH-dependent FMN reductase [Amycolatopsis azurea]|uniref:NADPH-dependent FMN reductase family protein n=1 Tax=Amycolatopsis azurea DSM 43854 TaxID=1238180 RepID=M2Q8G7_9PSEU|nr:NAD(P)H-dependent oxidoreductase [Amycolatopsis azurea]EMD22946.1 NADPH-dependent FMN reductase family protein [Amycolatopsis azurea DSM 43854]OOC04307.1 NADPH-dependent oxidoreductase [Amycolatopsis azurea DSM 43854]